MACPKNYKLREVDGKNICVYGGGDYVTSLTKSGASAQALIDRGEKHDGNPLFVWPTGEDANVENNTDPLQGILDGSFLSGLGFSNEDFFGTTPEAVPFEEVDTTQTILDAILGTTENLPHIEELTSGLNSIITENDLARVRALVPGFDKMNQTASANAQSLLSGELPFEDVLDITSDRSELANALGLQGASTNATLRDLGISRLEAQLQGNTFFNDIIARQETVSSSNKQISPGAFLLTPAQQVEAQFRNNENTQAANQASEFLKSRPNPTAKSLLEAALARYEAGTDPKDTQALEG